MSQGRLYDVLSRQRAALLRGERAAASELVRVYGKLWQTVQVHLADLLAEYAALAGQVDVGWLYQQDRLNILLGQIAGELDKFAGIAETTITEQQRLAIDAALRDTQRQVATIAGRAGVSISWTQLPTGALEAVVGFTADGSPLRELLERLGPTALQEIRDALLDGIALGQNPTEIARRVRQAFGGDLVRALRVARTEALRAYREGTLQSYAANEETVRAWMWICACTPRSCSACWAMHGTIHPLTERLEGHPNCRCTPAPVVNDVPNMLEQWLPDDGAKQFARLTWEEQRKVLGPGVYELYRDGKIDLADVVTRKFDRDWGSVRVPRSLASLKRSLT